MLPALARSPRRQLRLGIRRSRRSHSPTPPLETSDGAERLPSERAEPIKFPYQISTRTTKSSSCGVRTNEHVKWRVRIEWSTVVTSGTTVIDDKVRPFEVAASGPAPREAAALYPVSSSCSCSWSSRFARDVSSASMSQRNSFPTRMGLGRSSASTAFVTRSGDSVSVRLSRHGSADSRTGVAGFEGAPRCRT